MPDGRQLERIPAGPSTRQPQAYFRAPLERAESRRQRLQATDPSESGTLSGFEIIAYVFDAAARAASARLTAAAPGFRPC